MRESVKIVNAALDETPHGDIILRGVISHDSLKLLQVDDYQREVLPLSDHTSLVKALVDGTQVPDVTLGMRGGDYQERDGDFFLKDSVFIIDGLQRISSANYVMQAGANLTPRLGCTVTFNTSKEIEMELFRILNSEKARLSANILARNQRESNQAIEMLYELCEDSSFVLNDRVSWNQRMRRNELISAITLLKVVGMLHSSFGPGVSSTWHEVAKSLLRTMRDLVGRRAMSGNVKVFYEVLDGAFGIRSISYKEGAAHIKSGFMLALAKTLAMHKNFWDEHRRLVVSADFRRKIATFPINDPMIRGLIGTNNTARQQLTRLLVDHLNSNRRTNRLVPFREADVDPIEKKPKIQAA